MLNLLTVVLKKSKACFSGTFPRWRLEIDGTHVADMLERRSGTRLKQRHLGCDADTRVTQNWCSSINHASKRMQTVAVVVAARGRVKVVDAIPLMDGVVEQWQNPSGRIPDAGASLVDARRDALTGRGVSWRLG